MTIAEYKKLRKDLKRITKKYFHVTKNCCHFTDKDSYTKIIQSKTLRITNKNSVKDEQDTAYPETILKDCLIKLGSPEWVETEYLKFWNEHFIDGLYCFSASYQKNNNYLSKEYGSYSIKVNTKKMFNELKKDRNISTVKMGYTIYNPIEQRSVLLKLLKLYYKIEGLLHGSDISNDAEGYSLSQLECECKEYIIFLLDLIKKSSFSKEKEVRIVLVYNDITKDEYSKTKEDLKYYYAKNVDKYCRFLTK